MSFSGLSKAKDILKATGAEDIASSGDKSVSTHGGDTDRQATDLNETDRIRPSSIDSSRLGDEKEKPQGHWRSLTTETIS